MKVSIGSRIVEGPWGGGNLFAINLRDYLIKKGHKVVFDLAHSDIDLILLINCTILRIIDSYPSSFFVGIRLRSITLLSDDNKMPSILVPPKSIPMRFIITLLISNVTYL